jgi:hypothetical protein
VKIIEMFCQVLISAAVCTKSGKSKLNSRLLLFKSHSCFFHFSDCIPTVCRDDESENRGTSRRFSKTDDIRQTTYFRRNGFRALRLSTDGETLHAADHNES